MCKFNCLNKNKNLENKKPLKFLPGVYVNNCSPPEGYRPSAVSIRRLPHMVMMVDCSHLDVHFSTLYLILVNQFK
jgi:hypothetical protein